MNIWKKFKEKCRQYDHRADTHVTTLAIDNTEHVCQHCGTAYVGRYCPQCGLGKAYRRLTLKSLLLNFLDIWGMGSRPMPRALKELLWRPGYMIRDYLGGHHLNYFPPFKLLIVLTLIILLLTQIVEVDNVSEFSDLLSGKDLNLKTKEANDLLAPILQTGQKIVAWFQSHLAYNIIAQNVFVVLAVWFNFRKYPKKRVALVGENATEITGKQAAYTFTETFFSQIYINCQMLLIAIPFTLISWKFASRSIFPYFIPDDLVLLILWVDFYQLYGLSLLKTFWLIVRTILTYALIWILFIVLITLSIGFYVGVNVVTTT